MVAPSSNSKRTKKTKALGIPAIDLSLKRSIVSDSIVRACEEYGIFKVINHGVDEDVVGRLEMEGVDFFAKPSMEKQIAGPANPFGYGCKNIGFNGDVGELEYLLLHTNSISLSETSKTISSDPHQFRKAVSDYINEVRELACEVLDLASEGLWVTDKNVFSNLIRGGESDSLLRLNHYTPVKEEVVMDWDTSSPELRVGFGEHSDPQILTILRSNDVAGLQICLPDGLWVPVPPDPSAFYAIVGDSLQVMTNGRFVSVRHRVLANSIKPRMSTMYFAAPSLNAWIYPQPEMVSLTKPSLYRPFTWGDYKKTAYSSRLGDTRLDRFKIHDSKH